jgi:hypothetical protein
MSGWYSGVEGGHVLMHGSGICRFTAVVAISHAFRLRSGRFWLGCEPDKTAHVGDQVGEPELGRADDQAEPAFLSGERVLDRDPDPRPGGVGADDVRRHRSAARLRPLELRHQPAPGQERDVGRRPIGGVRPDRARGDRGPAASSSRPWCRRRLAHLLLRAASWVSIWPLLGSTTPSCAR